MYLYVKDAFFVLLIFNIGGGS